MLNQELRYQIWFSLNQKDHQCDISYDTAEKAQEMVSQFNRGSASQILGAKYYVVDSQALEESSAPPSWLRNPYVIAILVLLIALTLLLLAVVWQLPDIRANYLEYQTVPGVVSAWMNGCAR